MKFRLAAVLLALLPLAACQSQSEAPAADAAPADAPADNAPADTTPPADADAAPAQPEADTPPPGESPAATAAATEAAAPVPAPAAQPYTGPALVPGVDYVEIPGGQPFDPLDGKVEVVEMFNYICPACFAFNPTFESWRSKQAADVRVTLVPASFRPDFALYAKVYYAAESLGLLDKTHEATYKAIHMEHSMPGEGESLDVGKITAFYAKYGVSAEQFANAMDSFAVSGKLNKAKQFMVRSQIGGTPSLVVNGRYLVKGRSQEDMLRIADGLIAQERAAGAH